MHTYKLTIKRSKKGDARNGCGRLPAKQQLLAIIVSYDSIPYHPSLIAGGNEDIKSAHNFNPGEDRLDIIDIIEIKNLRC